MNSPPRFQPLSHGLTRYLSKSHSYRPLSRMSRVRSMASRSLRVSSITTSSRLKSTGVRSTTIGSCTSGTTALCSGFGFGAWPFLAAIVASNLARRSGVHDPPGIVSTSCLCGGCAGSACGSRSVASCSSALPIRPQLMQRCKSMARLPS